jgi:hypothetical protein
MQRSTAWLGGRRWPCHCHLRLPPTRRTRLRVAAAGAGSKGADRERNFLLMSWLKPALLLHLLRLGHAVMVADIDIAYAVKPLWRSYLAYIEQAQSDGAWLEEKPACERAALRFAALRLLHGRCVRGCHLSGLLTCAGRLDSRPGCGLLPDPAQPTRGTLCWCPPPPAWHSPGRGMRLRRP